jgi:hypothetical protein
VSAHPPRANGALLAALAGAIHLAFDALASRVEATTPPYLLLDHAGEVFRDLLLLDRTTILVGTAIAAAGVNGVISALLAVAVEGLSRRRVQTLAWVLFGLWVFSGGLLTLVYLTPPWGVVVGSLAAGLPRAWVVAWVLERYLPVPAEAPPSSGTTS